LKAGGGASYSSIFTTNAVDGRWRELNEEDAMEG
jgi:hypothetical protein